MGRLSLLFAFPLLTFGIVTGAVVNDAKYGTPWAWQANETLAILAWLLLAVVVVARIGWGWRGRKPALLTLVGFGLVFLRMLGV
jgi:ABC-type transport system involved in cytochrome c biogenesis permease subunit